MNRSDRHQLILNIIMEKGISTQEELVEELRNRGHEVTQATVSRDVSYLQLIKEMGTGGSFYKVPKNLSGVLPQRKYTMENVISDSVTKIDYVDHLMVLHTQPGGASTVAFYLDGENMSGVLGTIAGDDTLLIVLRDNETAIELMARWNKLLR